MIPAAGRGTRMLPATRSVPKAFLPIVDRPALQYVVEEAARAGIREVHVVVDAETVELVEKHFADSPAPELDDVDVRTLVQEQPLGLGDAVRTADAAVAGRPFAVLLADNLVPPDGDVLPGMVAEFAGVSLVCLRPVGADLLATLGVARIGEPHGVHCVELTGAVEKPGANAAPSNLALMGRYVFHPEIFDALRNLPAGYAGEVQLTDAIDALGIAGRCRGFVTETDLLDVGTPFGLLHASTVLGLAHTDYGPPLLELLDASRYAADRPPSEPS